MLNKKLLLVLFSILIASLACGQFDIGIETDSNTLPDPQINTTTGQEKPDSYLRSDQDEIDDNEEIEVPVQYMAYTNSNNVWVLEIGSGTPRQITSDAALFDGSNTTIEYSSPQLSSDGTLLVYRKDVGTPMEGGLDITADVWLKNMETGELSKLLTGRTMGFSWKPDSHELAFTTAIENYDYWVPRGQPSPELATGISLIDVDSGETVELVKPESGHTLSGPKWTRDGRFLYFAEVLGMEGSGNFAYYDLEKEEYVTWDEPVGRVSWSPDGESIAHSRQPYISYPEERLYLRARDGVEQQIGPEYEGDAYASHPTFSPMENKIAYLVNFDGPMTSATTVMILDLDGGEPRSLAVFEDVWELAWSLDGNNLIFSSGNWESRQIILLSVVDGSQTVIANGRQLSLTGQ